MNSCESVFYKYLHCRLELQFYVGILETCLEIWLNWQNHRVDHFVRPCRKKSCLSFQIREVKLSLAFNNECCVVIFGVTNNLESND